MNIGIVDADLLYHPRQRFPNLAAMKISGFHKDRGDRTKLLLDYNRLEEFDRVYISKVFTDTYIPAELVQMKNVVCGGTGFFYDKAAPLPKDVEHCMPDYTLYEQMNEIRKKQGEKKSAYKFYTDYSIGFLTRGCFRHCQFCVNQNSRKSVPASPLKEFLNEDKKKLCFLDDNFLACNKWESFMEDILETGKRFQFRQGLDIRIMQKRQMKKLFQGKFDGNVISAFDDFADKDLIVRKLDLLRETVPIQKKELKLYVLCGFDRMGKWNQEFWIRDIRETMQRIEILMKYKCLPYVMRFNKWMQAPEPYRGMYITISRWCNQPAQYTKRSLREFCVSQGEGKSQYRYLTSFECKHPEMKEYLDMKYNRMGG